jgi:hypothetical protein
MATDPNVAIRLNEALDVEEVWAVLLEHFHGMGFGCFAYLMFRADGFDQSPIFFADGFAPKLVDAFTTRGYGKDAPAMRLAMTSGKPLLAGKLDPQHISSPSEKLHRDAMMAAGLDEVLVLPVFGPSGRSAAAFLGGATTPDLYEPFKLAGEAISYPARLFEES